MAGAWITLNRVCNMHCSYCYLKSYKKTNNELKLLDAFDLINYIKSKKIDKVFLIGGEPTLYKNLLTIISYISAQKMKPFLLTNGINLANREFIKKLTNAGLFSLNISFKIEEWINNKISYEKIICDSILLLKEYKMNFLISFVITPQSLSHILDSIIFLKKLGVSYFYFAFENDTIKNKENLSDILKFITKIVDYYPQIKNLCPNFYIHSIYPICFYPIHFRKIILNDNKFIFLCQAHDKKSIIFDTNKDVLFCNQDYETKLLKYKNKNSLLKFEKNDLTLPFKVCMSCKYKELCGGGCPLKWKNYFLNNINFVES